MLNSQTAGASDICAWNPPVHKSPSPHRPRSVTNFNFHFGSCFVAIFKSVMDDVPAGLLADAHVASRVLKLRETLQMILKHSNHHLPAGPTKKANLTITTANANRSPRQTCERRTEKMASVHQPADQFYKVPLEDDSPIFPSLFDPSNDPTVQGNPSNLR